MEHVRHDGRRSGINYPRIHQIKIFTLRLVLVECIITSRVIYLQVEVKKKMNPVFETTVGIKEKKTG